MNRCRLLRFYAHTRAHTNASMCALFPIKSVHTHFHHHHLVATAIFAVASVLNQPTGLQQASVKLTAPTHLCFAWPFGAVLEPVNITLYIPLSRTHARSLILEPWRHPSACPPPAQQDRTSMESMPAFWTLAAFIDLTQLKMRLANMHK